MKRYFCDILLAVITIALCSIIWPLNLLQQYSAISEPDTSELMETGLISDKQYLNQNIYPLYSHIDYISLCARDMTAEQIGTLNVELINDKGEVLAGKDVSLSEILYLTLHQFI